jgi:hypothetical protein
MDTSFLDDSILAQQLMAAVSYLGAFLPQVKETVGV